MGERLQREDQEFVAHTFRLIEDTMGKLELLEHRARNFRLLRQEDQEIFWNQWDSMAMNLWRLTEYSGSYEQTIRWMGLTSGARLVELRQTCQRYQTTQALTVKPPKQT